MWIAFTNTVFLNGSWVLDFGVLAILGLWNLTRAYLFVSSEMENSLSPLFNITLCYAKSLQLCPILCDPIDDSPPGSPVPGILQARTLEWVAISFSNAGKWKVKVKSLSSVWLLATPWTTAHQAPPSMGLSRQEYWSGVPLQTANTKTLICEVFASWHSVPLKACFFFLLFYYKTYFLLLLSLLSVYLFLPSVFSYSS